MTDEPKTIESFLVVINDIPDYIGFIDTSLIEPLSYRRTMESWCYKEEVDGVTYIRMGVKGNGGTLLTAEEFQDYFDEYGQVMMTKSEWDTFKAEHEKETQI